VLDIGVIVAAIIFLKVDSPKRFYADPAASLVISLIIFYTAIPMSTYLQLHRENISPQETHFCLNLTRSFEVWKDSFRSFPHPFRPRKGERGSSLSKFFSRVDF
jgi:Co/Zn/Cd efflux system component